MNFSPTVITLLATLSLGVASVAGNANDISQDEALKLRRSGEVLPFQRILQAVFKRYPDATILEVELEEDDGEYYYELEILVDERVVRELDIDASSGKVLQDEVDD